MSSWMSRLMSKLSSSSEFEGAMISFECSGYFDERGVAAADGGFRN